MKKLFAVSVLVLLISLFTYSALSQEGTEYIVTAEDIQVCFPYTGGDGGGIVRQWYSPEGSAISYSAEPVGVHKPGATLGIIRFEASLQKSNPSLGKAVMDVTMTELPPDRTEMEFRFRVRRLPGPVVSNWSNPIKVEFIGAPGDPVHVEIPVSRS